MDNPNTRPTEVLLPALRDGRLERRESARATQRRTYYGQSIIKRPTWRWFIPFYCFLGGVASGASFIGALAELFGGKEHRSTVRNARYLALVLAVICPIPLIVDLGRPERFHHMLRVLKFSSPLSVGTWILSGFGLLSAMQAARQAAEDDVVLKRDSRLGRLATLLPSGPITVLHGLFGMGLGGCLAAIPACCSRSPRCRCGPRPASCSGHSSSPLLPHRGQRRWSSWGSCAATRAEKHASRFRWWPVSHRRSSSGLPRPMRHSCPSGSTGRCAMARGGGSSAMAPSRSGLFLPTVLRGIAWYSGPRIEWALSTASAAFTLAGTLAERFAIVEAGKVSADDPIAYQALTRSPPGEARLTSAQQTRRAPAAQPFVERVVAPELTGP